MPKTTPRAVNSGDAIEAAATGHGHPAVAALLRVLADRDDHDPAVLMRVADSEEHLDALYSDVVGPFVDLLGELITLNYGPVAAHECEWVPVTTDGPLGHGWECTICGEYQAG